MSLLPFSTIERNDVEIPVPSATSARRRRANGAADEASRRPHSCSTRVPLAVRRCRRDRCSSWGRGLDSVAQEEDLRLVGDDEAMPAIVRQRARVRQAVRSTRLAVEGSPRSSPGTTRALIRRAAAGSSPTSKSTIRLVGSTSARAKVSPPSKSDVPLTTPPECATAPQQPSAHSPSRLGSDRYANASSAVAEQSDETVCEIGGGHGRASSGAPARRPRERVATSGSSAVG